jgi:hypothetical protein
MSDLDAAFDAWIDAASREDLQRVLREYSEELDDLHEGFISQMKEIQRLRRVKLSAEAVHLAAFVTQLNDRSWLLPKMQALGDALFRADHPGLFEESPEDQRKRIAACPVTGERSSPKDFSSQ